MVEPVSRLTVIEQLASRIRHMRSSRVLARRRHVERCCAAAVFRHVTPDGLLLRNLGVRNRKPCGFGRLRRMTQTPVSQEQPNGFQEEVTDSTRVVMLPSIAVRTTAIATTATGMALHAC